MSTSVVSDFETKLTLKSLFEVAIEGLILSSKRAPLSISAKVLANAVLDSSGDSFLAFFEGKHPELVGMLGASDCNLWARTLCEQHRFKIESARAAAL
jgi:hypothetical protein